MGTAEFLTLIRNCGSRESDHSSPCSNKVKNEWSCTSLCTVVSSWRAQEKTLNVPSLIHTTNKQQLLLYSINRTDYLMETQGVLCKVRNESPSTG